MGHGLAGHKLGGGTGGAGGTVDAVARAAASSAQAAADDADSDAATAQATADAALAASGGGPQFTDYATDGTYYYYGLDQAAWQINRRLVDSPYTKTLATEANNSGVTTFAAAWAARTSLTYG